jgi:uncharacterized 2Fe-2S/4Fe-4S cluster protein (DUF4445 family)
MNLAIDASSGEPLLESLRAGRVGLVALCGGTGKCGKCRVQVVSGQVSELTSVEEDGLSPEELDEGFRLACQCRALGDLTIDIPASSLEMTQRLQLEGEGGSVALEPSVTAVPVQMSAPHSEDLIADADRLENALRAAGCSPASTPRGLLTELSSDLRELGWEGRAVLQDGRIVTFLPVDASMAGLAVDLGTTKMAGYLIDLDSGKSLAKTGMMNPQVEYGDDVLSRIAFANEDSAGRRHLQRTVVDGISELVEALCRDAGIERDQIVDAVVVGNTAMHHLFAGIAVRQLGLVPYVPAVGASLAFASDEIGLSLAPGAQIYMPPNIAGFVGADHVAMLLATQAHKAEGTTMALDIGTNTEITLAVDGRLLACSCASGPAFEGAHIRDGMRAAPGAVERVSIWDGEVHLETIEGQPPVGICGSGILDAVAGMFRHGIIDRSGRFREDKLESEVTDPFFPLVESSVAGRGRPLGLTLQDVREIQLAKGAIRAGIEILLREANITFGELDEVIVAGAFGTYLGIDSAVSIGMFPPLASDKFRQVGNAAGMGAVRLLLSESERAEAERIRKSIEYVELTVHPLFTKVFAHALRFGEYLGP